MRDRTSALDIQATTVVLTEARPDLAIFPIAALEQHGPHLPVATDWIVVDEIARRVARSFPSAFLLPTLPFGTSLAHQGTAGTVSLSWPTLMHVVTDVVESLLWQGIRRVAVINNLGEVTGTTVQPRGNFIVKTAVRQLNYAHPELDAVWVQPLAVAGAALQEVFSAPQDDVHAGEVETSLLLALRPDLVEGAAPDCVPSLPRTFTDLAPFERLAPGGVWGRPERAGAAKGEAALAAVVPATVRYIEESLAFLATAKGRYGRSG